jgi:hypothetical protein
MSIQQNSAYDTDGHVLTPSAPNSDDENVIRIREIDRWSAGQLSEDERAFVASFAPTVTLPLANGGSLLCYHGSPRSYNDVLLPTTSTEELNALLGEVTATVLAGGHTHQQMLRRHHKSLVLNPGSVGLPMDRVPADSSTLNPSWAEFAVLTCGAEGSLRIELCRIPFDGAALLDAVRQSGMPHAEWFASDWDMG